MEPQQNMFIDWLSFGCVAAYFTFVIVFGAIFLALKHKGKIQSSFKDWYLILSSIASISHISMIIITYGFFWPQLDLTVPCSLWNFWLQWFLGFAVWIGILCTRIFAMGQGSIHQLNVNSNNVRLIQRIGVFAIVIVIIGIIGIVAEATSGFYINDHGKCTTALWIKLLILVWLIVIIIFLAVLAHLIKQHGHIPSTSHLVTLELKIVKVTWPILVACVLLNFSGLTSYAIVRYIFLMLIITMYAWAAIVLYVSQVIVYYFSHYSVVIAMIDYFDIYIPPTSTYTSGYGEISNDSGGHNDRESIDETRQYIGNEPAPDLFMTTAFDGTSADRLLSKTTSPSSSHEIPILGEDLESINVDEVRGRSRMINTIKTSNETFDSFLGTLCNQCTDEFKHTGVEKTMTLGYFDRQTECLSQLDVPLYDLIKFIERIRTIRNNYVFSRQLDTLAFINEFRSVISEYITRDVDEGVVIEFDTDMPRKLENLNDYPIISDIIHHLLASPDIDAKCKFINEKITEFYKDVKDRLIDTFFTFWSQSEGLKNLIESQKQKKEAVIILDDDSSF